MASVCLGDREYFPNVERVRFEGPDTDNPFAFRFYNPNRMIAGKSMSEHFRFAVAYWHTFCGLGQDPFGSPTKVFPWLESSDPNVRAREKMDAAFEFCTKLGAQFFCFHDLDLVDEGPTLTETHRRLNTIVDYAEKKQEESGLRVLFGTANLFSNPRYMNGAATNPDFSVVAYAGAQVRAALDATIRLGGENYVFWGGREGYLSLLNTQMKREQEHLARFLHMAVEYGRRNGFEGQYLIEPKPMEPSKHQYDYDAATVIAFLKTYGLSEHFKLNLEVNHATLAGHTMAHEMQVAADAGKLGSMDANRGDYQNGWDTDQFPNDVYELTEMMLVLLEAGGFSKGGINFDAKTRRNSTHLDDIFFSHIGGMDAFAKALVAADKILKRSDYLALRRERYASFDTGKGAEFASGRLSLEDLNQYAMESDDPETISGQQERYENILNRYI